MCGYSGCLKLLPIYMGVRESGKGEKMGGERKEERGKEAEGEGRREGGRVLPR